MTSLGLTIRNLAKDSPKVARAARRGRLSSPSPIRYPSTVAKEYLKHVLRMVEPARELIEKHVIERLPALVRSAGLAGDDVSRADDYHDEIGATFDWIRTDYLRRVPDDQVRQTARAAGMDVSAHNRKEVSGQFRSVLGLDVLASEPWLSAMVGGFVKENVSLIKSIPSRYFDEVENIVERGVRSGRRAEDIAPEIRKRFGVSESRAALIARDQVGKFNGQLTRQRHQDLGLKRYRWRNSRDERVRGNPGGLYPDAKYSHHEREGKVYAYAKPPPDGNPGEPIRCFPSESQLESGYCAVKLYRRWYTGELTEIITSSGKALVGTPNHPILTPRGWLALKDVNDGDCVIQASQQRAWFLEHDIDQHTPSMGDVFNALSVVTAKKKRPGALDQFHGDGTGEDVDVIDATGCLPDNIDPLVIEAFGKKLFAESDVLLDDSLLSGHSGMLQAIGVLWPAPHGIVRGCGKLLALLCGQSPHAEEVRRATVSRFNSMLQESRPDGGSVDSILSCHSEFAEPGGVVSDDSLVVNILAVMRRVALSFGCAQPSATEIEAKVVRADTETGRNSLEAQPRMETALRVVEKRTREFSGHVHNLETSCGWYVTQGIIVHNCRCWAEPLFEDILGPEFAMDLTPARVAGQYRIVRQSPAAPAPNPKPSAEAKSTLAQAEDAIRKEKIEHLKAFDGDGRLIHEATGDEGSVPISEELWSEMLRRGDVTVTHTHPKGTPLSGRDIRNAVAANMKESRATHPDGGAWTIRRPVGGWRTDIEPDRLEKEIDDAFSRGVKKFDKRLAKLVRNGDLDGMSHHEKLELLAGAQNEEIQKAVNKYARAQGFPWKVVFDK